MDRKYEVTADISQDGELCRVQSTSPSGDQSSIIFDADSLVQLMAALAHCAMNIQKAKGSENISFFPVQSFGVRQQPGRDYVLVTFEVDPGIEMTFGLDKSSLRDVLSGISQFLEDGSGGTKSFRTH